MSTAVRPEPKFKIGDRVQRTNQPEAFGEIRDIRWDSQTRTWKYVVEIPGVGMPTIQEHALRPYVRMKLPWEALANGEVSGHKHFIYNLTYQRLRHPPTRIARSFVTARTQFYPHQFRPVLKFLDNPANRLLIADDVGLGKTIEAGYILRELSLRQGGLERVLVLVPARLKSKWKRELRDRFGETFEAVGSAELAAQIQRVRAGSDPESFHWIISYESARSAKVLEAFGDDVQLPLDALVADEAHRMRNPDALQHRIGALLCNSADTVLFLSATPVQTDLENLFHLLRMLSSEEFQQYAVFEQQMEANKHLLTAQRLLPNAAPDFDGAAAAFGRFNRLLEQLGMPRTQLAESVESRLERRDTRCPSLAELRADIGLLSPTAHILSRTRKIEALPNSPIRKARWVSVELTDAERRIYDSVEELCRLTWGGNANGWGFQMSVLMAYRITASCIPAAMRYFREKLTAARYQMVSVDPDRNEEDDLNADGTIWDVNEIRERIGGVLVHYDERSLPDSKLAVLLDALKVAWQDDDDAARPRRKVVLFSFFRRTLEYLASALRQSGIMNEMIHGLIPVPDREQLIDHFLMDPEVPILLTSEVGGEGVDLQKASIVVNYDLPWNPMVVEQRIGRVDRIGQESPIIQVMNFVVANSVEQRIIERLLKRIRIFQESIGELDDIIGNRIEELTALALRGSLTPEELEKQLLQTEQALEQQILGARQVLSKVDSLIAADEALINEIQTTVGERQLPSESELLLFLNHVLGRHYPGSLLPKDAAHSAVQVDLHGRLANDIEARAAALGDDAFTFSRRIAGGSVLVTLSRDAAYRHPRAELIHFHHPLCRLVLSLMDEADVSRNGAFAIAMPGGPLPRGDYAFLIALLEIDSFRASTRIVATFATLDGQRTWNDPADTTPMLIRMLENGTDTTAPNVPRETLATVKEVLRDALERLEAQWDQRERKVDQLRGEQNRAAQAAALEYRLRQAEARLADLTSKGARAFAVQMARAQVDKARERRDAFLAMPLRTQWGGISHQEIAVGYLRVEA